MQVMKFGGTSVGSAAAISQAVSIVQKALPKKPVVVVSAVSKITDALLLLATEVQKGKGKETLQHIFSVHEQIIADLGLDPLLCETEFTELEELFAERMKQKTDLATLDIFLSFGERLCARIVAAKLTQDGVAAKAYPAWELGMITNDNFGDAEPLNTSYASLKRKISNLKAVPVITGFIGKTRVGQITTLGRGGSDYSAAIIGAAINAERIQIWKDVDGIMTTDPRLVPKAKLIPELAFEEACELTSFGAKVLHPKTILPAMKKDIPVQVLNTFNPEGTGTTIVSNFDERKKKSETIEGLTVKRGVIAIHIRSPKFFDGTGLMARIFDLFEAHKTSIDVVSTSMVSVSVTIDRGENLDKIVRALKTMADVTVVRNKAIVCAVGGSVNAAGVVGKMFTILGKKRIRVEMISQAASEVSILFVVDQDDAEETVRILHKEYIEE